MILRKQNDLAPGSHCMHFSHCSRLLGESDATYWTEENNRRKRGGWGWGPRCLHFVNGWPWPRRQCLPESHVLEGKKRCQESRRMSENGCPTSWASPWGKSLEKRKLTKRSDQAYVWSMRRNKGEMCLLRLASSGVPGVFGVHEPLERHPFCDQEEEQTFGTGHRQQ